MASGALFGNSGSRNTGKYLTDFRAGKMFMKGKMVHPDKRKGQIYIYQSDDSLMHFCWKDRSKNIVEDDLIIFPDDCEFKHVTQCTSGRVYLLKFRSTARKMFFWMQEPKSDKDEENAKKINETLNNPPTPGQARGGPGGTTGLNALGALPPELAAGLGGDSDLSSLLGNMSQQQLMQLLGGMGMGGIGGLGGLSALMGGRPGSTQSDSAPPSRVQSSPGPRHAQLSPSESNNSQPPRPVTAAALPSQHKSDSSESKRENAMQDSESHEDQEKAEKENVKIQLSDLKNILTGMGGQENDSIDLASAVSPDLMVPILSHPEVQERLKPFLPAGESLPKTESEVIETISTPQFKQAMNIFSSALASGQLGALMGQFGLGDEVSGAAAAGDVEAFAKAMQEAEKKRNKDNE